MSNDWEETVDSGVSSEGDDVDTEDDDVEDEELSDAGNDVTEPPKKRARLAARELYKAPTSDEINRLKETENLFHSSLFRMQVCVDVFRSSRCFVSSSMNQFRETVFKHLFFKIIVHSSQAGVLCQFLILKPPTAHAHTHTHTHTHTHSRAAVHCQSFLCSVFRSRSCWVKCN